MDYAMLARFAKQAAEGYRNASGDARAKIAAIWWFVDVLRAQGDAIFGDRQEEIQRHVISALGALSSAEAEEAAAYRFWKNFEAVERGYTMLLAYLIEKKERESEICARLIALCDAIYDAWKRRETEITDGDTINTGDLER